MQTFTNIFNKICTHFTFVRFWKTLGVWFESEMSERKARDKAISTDLLSRMIPLLYKDPNHPDR